MTVAETLPEPAVLLRHTSTGVVDIVLTVEAICRSCGRTHGRRFTTTDDLHDHMQDVGPWADQHADECPNTTTPEESHV